LTSSFLDCSGSFPPRLRSGHPPMGGSKSKPHQGSDLKFDSSTLPPRHQVSAEDRKKAMEEVADVIAGKRVDFIGNGVGVAGADNENLLKNLVSVLKFFPDAALEIQCVTGGTKKNDVPSQKRGDLVKKELFKKGLVEHYPVDIVLVTDKYSKDQKKALPPNGFVRFALKKAVTEYEPFKHLEAVTANKENRIVFNDDCALSEAGLAACRDIYAAVRDVPRELVIRSCDFYNVENANKRALAVQANLKSMGLANELEVVIFGEEYRQQRRPSVETTASQKTAGYKVAVTFLTDEEKKERAEAEEKRKADEEAEEQRKKEAEMEPQIVEEVNKKPCACF